MHTALILAAGRGERLKPLTDTKPKALCLVNEIPLIEHHIQHLVRAGIQRIVINHAYLGGLIRRRLGNGQAWNIHILYSPEPPGALETGGGIFNALPLLGTDPFIVVNADIYCDYDYAHLSLPETSLAHLILVNKPIYYRAGDFGLTETNWLENKKHYTFAGVACYHPALFKHCKPGRYSLTPLLRTLAKQQHATGELHEGIWLDIGSLERLRQANQWFKKVTI